MDKEQGSVLDIRKVFYDFRDHIKENNGSDIVSIGNNLVKGTVPKSNS